MRIVTKKQQKAIDKMNIRKIAFAIKSEAQDKKYTRHQLFILAENIYYADNVII